MSDIWHDESWLMTVMTVMEVGGKIIIESLGFFGFGNPFLARIWDLDATCAAHIAELSFIWFCTCMWWQRTAIHHFNRHQENQSSASYQSHFKTFNCHVSLWLPDCARVPDSRVSVFVGRSIYGSIIMSIFILSYHILSSCITRFPLILLLPLLRSLLLFAVKGVDFVKRGCNSCDGVQCHSSSHRSGVSRSYSGAGVVRKDIMKAWRHWRY